MKKWIKVEDLIDDILAEEIIVKEIKYFLKGTEEEILVWLKWDYSEHYYKTIEEKEKWIHDHTEIIPLKIYCL